MTAVDWFSKDYEIKYYEQNVNGVLKESSLLNLLQDIATISAESLGFGPSFVFANNYAWVVLRYHIEIYKEIKNKPLITIKTLPRGISKLYAFRDFEICTPEGDLLGKAVSTWMLIDINTRRPLPAQKVLTMMPSFEKQETDIQYVNFSSDGQSIYEKSFDVRFDDIDINQHANNCNYIIWALEALPAEFRQTKSPKIIDIKYRKETNMGAKVLSQVCVEDNISIHKIIENSDELCSLRIEWN